MQYFVPQLVVLFWEVVDPLESIDLVKEVGHWTLALRLIAWPASGLEYVSIIIKM